MAVPDTQDTGWAVLVIRVLFCGVEEGVRLQVRELMKRQEPIMLIEKVGIRYDIDPKELIDRTTMMEGAFESRMVKMTESLLKHGDIAVDVGANIGTYSLRWAKVVGERGKVIAFEPMAFAYAKLTRNIELNGFKNIDVHRKAVSDITDRQEVWFRSSWILKEGAYGTIPESSRPELVEFVRLDDIIKGDVALIKIDVDGFEMNVLNGAKDIINRCHPALMVEINEPKTQTYIESLGYRAIFTHTHNCLFIWT